MARKHMPTSLYKVLATPAGVRNAIEQTIDRRLVAARLGWQENRVKTGLKLVLKLPEERVVGLHCIGPFSDEMLQGFAVAVRMGATRMDFEASVAIHPTVAEEFVTFGGWGQSKDKDSRTVRPSACATAGRRSVALLWCCGLWFCCSVALPPSD